MMQGQPDAGQLMQQLIQIREQHPDAYPAALQHTLELYGGDVKQFIAALQNEQGGQQPQQAQEQPPAPQAAPQPAVQQQPLQQPLQQPPQQKAPPPAPPIKAPAPPTTGFGMSQGPRFLNGPTTADKTAAGLMAGMPVRQAQGNAMAAKPHMAAGGQVTPPLGSTPEEVADDIPAQLSQDETVIPANVSKWFGQRTFEQMKQEAEQGFAKMAQEGRLKSGGGNADGGMQDLTSVLATEQLAEDNKKKLRDAPDDDIGHPTGFMAGGQVLPNASPVDGFADGGFAQDPSAVYVGADGGNTADPNKDITNNSPQSDPSSWGTSKDPHKDAYNFGVGAVNSAMGMGAAGLATGLGAHVASNMIDAARQNPAQSPSFTDAIGKAIDPRNGMLGKIGSWLGIGMEQAAAATSGSTPDNSVGNLGAENDAANETPTGIDSSGLVGTAADVTSPEQENSANGNAYGGAPSNDGRSNISPDSVDTGDTGREGSGGRDSEGSFGGGHDSESAGGAGEGGDSGNAATGGFFAKVQPKLKKINKDKMRKSEDKAPKFMVGGFVEPRASVRKITNRGIKVPKIL